jgi:hypothetical protein
MPESLIAIFNTSIIFDHLEFIVNHSDDDKMNTTLSALAGE